MHALTRTAHHRLVALAALVVVTFCPFLSARATAACFSEPSKTPLTAPRALYGAAPAALGLDDTPGALVGLWNSEFLLGDGPAHYDQSFQIIHSDGTEMMISNGLPPSLGNVCVGLWKQIGPRAFRLKHMTWNWNSDGSLAGTFLLTVTLRLDRRGTSYLGTWSADNFKPDGTPDPALPHAEGTARGTRISMD